MRLVLVEWVDSNCEGGWMLHEEAERSVDDNELRCETVGWVLAENDRYIAVAMSRTIERGDKDQVCDVMQIPMVAVTRVKSLTALLVPA